MLRGKYPYAVEATPSMSIDLELYPHHSPSLKKNSLGVLMSNFARGEDTRSIINTFNIYPFTILPQSQPLFVVSKAKIEILSSCCS